MFFILSFVIGSIVAATVTLDPNNASPFNNGEFQGWGTALCWWANRLGASKELTQLAVDLFFGKDGLHLDIGRYNVGGGDNPSHNHITRSDSNIPGYSTGFASNGSINFTWNVDENQRAFTRAALVANPDLYLEGFSNSPPYYMTVSGCTSGSADGAQDNLKTGNYADFATYIATVTKHFRDEWNLTFRSYSPINEPSLTQWKANSAQQEGCHYGSGTAESNIIVQTRRALDAAGLKDVLVAGMDESQLEQTVNNLGSLTAEAQTALGRVDTHTYGGSARAQVKAKAISMKKDLWMSEVDSSNTAGSNAGNMGGGLWLANRILEDMNGMQPAAWCTWNPIDIHKDSTFVAPNGEKSEANKSINQNNGLWGFGMADHDAKKIILTQKYYVFGQFTRYIRAGDTIIGTSSNRVLAAHNKKTGAVKIVAVNDGGSAQSYTFNLSTLNVTAGASAQGYRTSGAYDGGEHWRDVGKTAIANKEFTVSLPANSVTSFVIE